MINIRANALGPKKAKVASPSADAYRTALDALKPVILVVLAFSAIVNILMLTGSIYMLQVYDRVLASGSLETLQGLFTIVVVLFVFLGFFDFLRVRLLARSALRLDLSASPSTLDMWVEAGLPGSKQDSPQPLRDLSAIRSFISGPAVPAIFDSPFVFLYVGVLFLIHPWLGVLTLCGAVLTAILAFVTQTLTTKSLQQAAGLSAQERDFANSTHSNAEAITAMGMQHMITKHWQKLHLATLASSQKGSDPSEVLAASSRAFRMLLQLSLIHI